MWQINFDLIWHTQSHRPPYKHTTQSIPLHKETHTNSQHSCTLCSYIHRNMQRKSCNHHHTFCYITPQEPSDKHAFILVTSGEWVQQFTPCDKGWERVTLSLRLACNFPFSGRALKFSHWYAESHYSGYYWQRSDQPEENDFPTLLLQSHRHHTNSEDPFFLSSSPGMSLITIIMFRMEAPSNKPEKRTNQSSSDNTGTELWSRPTGTTTVSPQYTDPEAEAQLL